MNEQKRKRVLRIGCLVLAGVFVLSLLGSILMMCMIQRKQEQRWEENHYHYLSRQWVVSLQD